jgi:RNA polymerase sigma factor (sigma-70 family)
MANDRALLLLRHLRRLTPGPADAALSDRELLRRFASRRDEAAFEAVMARHGTMVLRLCRRLAPTPQDAEDVFQATFLVLARKASWPGWQDSVAGWLYRVAQRLARDVRTAAARRQERDGQHLPRPVADPLHEITVREAQAVLDDELAQLPEKYRAPLVLCCLEGLARDEAAQQLGWRPGLVKSRLERGRELLRGRLGRRGLSLSAGLAVVTLAPEGMAVVPAVLREATLRAAVLFTTNRVAAAGTVAANVLTLAEGVWSAMWMTNLKIAAAVALAVGVMGTGGGLLAYRVAGAQPAGNAAVQIQERPADKAEDDDDRAKALAEEAARKTKREQQDAIRRAMNQSQELEAAFDAQERRWMEELLEARRRELQAEEQFREVERLLAAQREQEKADWDVKRATLDTTLSQRARSLQETLDSSLRRSVQGEKDPLVKKTKAELEQVLAEYRKRESELLKERDRWPDAEKRRTEQLINARLQVIEADANVRRVERRQARERNRLQLRLDASDDTVRRLEGAAPAERTNRRTTDLEAKLEQLLREVAELRREVQRLAPSRTNKP